MHRQAPGFGSVHGGAAWGLALCEAAKGAVGCVPRSPCLYESAGAATHATMGWWLKPQKCVVPQFWRLKV